VVATTSNQVVRLGLEEVWRTTRGAGVRVAVLDTGAWTSAALPANRVQTMRADGGAPGPTTDPHGTFCGALVGSSAADAEGAAPEANLLAIQIATRSEDISAVDVTGGLERALAEGCDVISCSFTLQSWGGQAAAIQDLVRQAHSRGIPVLAAHGNAPDDATPFPEEAPQAIVVSAHDEHARVQAVKFAVTDLFCLGDNLTVVNGSGQRRTWTGLTSGATALLAGVVALGLAAVPEEKRVSAGMAVADLLKASGASMQLPDGVTALRVDARRFVAAARAF
jgi:membrane-anchored mycosin MYCP